MIEGAQEKAAVTAGGQHVGRGPNPLDDRELKSPEEATGQAHAAGTEEPQNLSVVGDSLVPEQQAGEDPEQAGGDGRQRAQQAFGIVSTVQSEARQVFEINLLGEVQPVLEAATDEVGSAVEEGSRLRAVRVKVELSEVLAGEVEIPDGHERGQRPIPQEEICADCNQAAQAEGTKEDARKEVAEGNALQHPYPADMVHALGEPAIVEQAEGVEAQAAEQNAFQGLGLATAFDGPAQREDEGHADNKDEERKDQVVKGHALPVLMVHLGIQRVNGTDVPGLVESANKFLAADNPEHVKPAQGIQRQKTAGGSLTRGHRLR